MEHKDISVGLDIGTTKIVAMIGRRNEFGKIELLGTGKAKSLGVHRGVVNNITQTIQSIQLAVDEAIAVSGISIKEAVVGIAGQHIRSLQHSDYITRANSEEVISDADLDHRYHKSPHQYCPNHHKHSLQLSSSWILNGVDQDEITISLE